MTRMEFSTLRLISIGELIIEWKPTVKYRLEDELLQVNQKSRGRGCNWSLISTRGTPSYGSDTIVLLYFLEVWADALGKKIYRNRLSKCTHGELCEWHLIAVSEPTVMVISVSLFANECKPIYRRPWRMAKHASREATLLAKWVKR